jgi:elongation factor Ts
MIIPAEMVKELRERTGAGMMECKRALTESGGDIEAAVEKMRKSGLAKADKKAGRIAAEGCIGIDQSKDAIAMVEVNCETDFVAKGEDFTTFVSKVTRTALLKAPADVDILMGLQFKDGNSLDMARRELVVKVGENITVRRYVNYKKSSEGILSSYCHGSRIGVLVEIQGGDTGLAKDIAMHIAASKPSYLKPEQVPAEVLEQEREIIRAQSVDNSKPAAIVEKMVEGRLRKFLAEVTLMGQPFVKQPDITVEKLLAQAGAKVLRFTRFEVGEGIEKKQEDFAASVMAQVRGA